MNSLVRLNINYKKHVSMFEVDTVSNLTFTQYKIPYHTSNILRLHIDNTCLGNRDNNKAQKCYLYVESYIVGGIMQKSKCLKICYSVVYILHVLYTSKIRIAI